MRGGAVLWLAVLCVVLGLPGDGVELGSNGRMVGLGEGASRGAVDLHKHHKHKHPPPPSPSPPPPSPPPPPPPPLATVNSLEISNGALLVPPFDPAVHRYTTTVGEGVTQVHVTVSVPESFEVYKVKLNSSKLVSGEESPPIPIGGNGETVDLVITISAPNHSSNKYYLSVHRIEKPSELRRILKQCLVVVLVILLIACILYITFSIVRASSCSYRWLPLDSHPRQYQPVSSDPESP